jgi:hypothetical protein
LKIVYFEYNFLTVLEWSGRHLTPAGNRGKVETPQAKPRRLDFLPAESKCLERNGKTQNIIPKKQQRMRKQPKRKNKTRFG